MADQISSQTIPNRTIDTSQLGNSQGSDSTKTPPGLPASVRVKMIDRKSADYNLFHNAWDLMYLLYVGGVEIEAVAEQFLKKRSKELPDVYQSRVERFYYESHVGTAIDWYLAALLETPPQVETAIEDDAPQKPAAPAPKPVPAPLPPNKPGQPPTAPPPMQQLPPSKPTSMTPADADEYYDQFEQNCDRAGTPVLEQIRAYFKNLLIFGRAAMLIDLPQKGDFKNLLEEKEAGQYDPFTVNYDPRQMINYQKDKNGRLLWCIFSNRETETVSPFEKDVVSDNWYYFDRTQWAKYQYVVPEGENTTPDDAMAQKVGGGEHALSAKQAVPVIYIELPRGLWLMNRAYSVTKEHLNTSCALSWALYMACLAMPVIKMDGEFTPELSEAGFIKLPKDAEYSWSEPEGKSFDHMAKRLDTLKEEIFRAFYLIAQARSTGATPSSQSGVSKQQDMMASKKVLNLYGDVMRAMIQALYTFVSWARDDEYQWDVRGLNFPEGPPDEEIDTVAGAMAIDVPSISFEKELYKKVVMATIPDMNPKKKAQIFTEIEQAPSAQDRETSQLMQRAQMVQAADTFPKGSL